MKPGDNSPQVSSLRGKPTARITPLGQHPGMVRGSRGSRSPSQPWERLIESSGTLVVIGRRWIAPPFLRSSPQQPPNTPVTSPARPCCDNSHQTRDVRLIHHFLSGPIQRARAGRELGGVNQTVATRFATGHFHPWVRYFV